MNTGRDGEDEAAAWLQSQGHVILERNWRSGHLEVDIISLDRDGLHFVEVKTRRAPVEGRPEESVGPAKQRNLANAARAYIRKGIFERAGDVEVFFDIVAIVRHRDRTEFNYIPKAFIPIYV